MSGEVGSRGLLAGIRDDVDRLGMVRVEHHARRGLVGADEGAGLLGHDAEDRVDVVGRVDAVGDVGELLELEGPPPRRLLGLLPSVMSRVEPATASTEPSGAKTGTKMYS